MKKKSVLAISLVLFIASIVAIAVNNYPVMDRIKTAQLERKVYRGKSAMPEIPFTTVEAYLTVSNHLEIYAEGADATFDVRLVNETTGEFVLDQPVECFDGISSYELLPELEEGTYAVIIRVGQQMWEGVFYID